MLSESHLLPEEAFWGVFKHFPKKKKKKKHFPTWWEFLFLAVIWFLTQLSTKLNFMGSLFHVKSPGYNLALHDDLRSSYSLCPPVGIHHGWAGNTHSVDTPQGIQFIICFPTLLLWNCLISGRGKFPSGSHPCCDDVLPQKREVADSQEPAVADSVAPHWQSRKQRGQATNRSRLSRHWAHTKPKARPPTATPCGGLLTQASLGGEQSHQQYLLQTRYSLRTMTHPLQLTQTGKGIAFPKWTTFQSSKEKKLQYIFFPWDSQKILNAG